jgi:hypothetical protein
LIGSADFLGFERSCFQEANDNESAKFWASITPHHHFEVILPNCSFKEKEESDPWFRFSTAVEKFNRINAVFLRLSTCSDE